MDKSKSNVLYQWATGLIGEIVKYPTGNWRNKQFTDHELVSVNVDDSFSQNRSQENLNFSVTLKDLDNNKTMLVSPRMLKKYNPDA